MDKFFGKLEGIGICKGCIESLSHDLNICYFFAVEFKHWALLPRG